MSLLLLSEYKSVLKIDGNTQDEVVEQLRLELELRIKNYLNRDLELTSYVEIYDGTGEEYLITKQFPVTEVTKLEFYDGVSNGTEIWEEQVQGTDYDRLIKTDKGLYLDGIVFPYGQQNIRLTYTAGYRNIPADIQSVAKQLMILYYSEQEKTQSIGKSSVSESSGQGTRTTTYFKDEEERILREIIGYRNFNV